MSWWGGAPKGGNSRKDGDGFSSGETWGQDPATETIAGEEGAPFEDSFKDDSLGEQWNDNVSGAEEWGSEEEMKGEGGFAGLPPRLPQPPPQPSAPGAVEPKKGKPPLNIGLTICAIDGVVSFVQGAGVGSCFGAFFGASEAFQAGLRGGDLARHVAARTRTSAGQFGSWLGCFRMVKCSMQTAREKKDFLNGAVAGGVAGVIPVLRTGNPRVILVTGLGSAVFMGALEGVESLFSHGGQQRGS